MSDSRVEESLKDIYERLRPGEPKQLIHHVRCWLHVSLIQNVMI